MLTNLNKMYNKKYMLEVTEDIRLTIEVLSERNVLYQFEGVNQAGDIIKDRAVISPLEVAYDNIEGVSDYSFFDGIATRFFLFQFEPVEPEVLNVKFISVWDGGLEIETNAQLNVQTKDVFNIELAESVDDEGDEVEHLDEEYILLPTGEKMEVIEVNNGYRTI